MAAIVAETGTYPFDITKTRLQLQGEMKSQRVKEGSIHTALKIVRNEGFFSLYQGLAPALLRHVVYSGIRVNIYEQIRDALGGRESQNPASALAKKIFAGASAGAISQFFASPCDLVKVRLQAQGRTIGVRRYSGTLQAFRSIAKEEGFFGLWKGVGPNVQRAALVNLGELATYDTSKQYILKQWGLKDNVFSHFLASVMSGLVGTICSCPADVVKTRMMNQSSGNLLYSSSIDCFIKVVKTEGFFALYKGFFPCWMRLGPWQLYFWLTYEQLRSFCGIGTF